MWRKHLVGLSALLVAAWAIFALSCASSPPAEGLLGPSVLIGVTFTCVAGWLIVRGWTEATVVPTAVKVTWFTTLLVVVLAALVHGS